jgi:hypothetical protein
VEKTEYSAAEEVQKFLNQFMWKTSTRPAGIKVGGGASSARASIALNDSAYSGMFSAISRTRLSVYWRLPYPAPISLLKNPHPIFFGEDEERNPNPVNLINKS